MKIKGRRIKPDRIPLPTCMNRDPTSKLKSQLQYNKKMLSQCMFVPRLKKEKVDFRVLGGCRERGDNIYSISIYNMTKLKIFSLIFCINLYSISSDTIIHTVQYNKIYHDVWSAIIIIITTKLTYSSTVYLNLQGPGNL